MRLKCNPLHLRGVLGSKMSASTGHVDVVVYGQSFRYTKAI